MSLLYDIHFSLFEMLSLLGLAQVVYILVYMGFRAGRWTQALLPSAYFLLLGGAFLLDFAQNYIGSGLAHYSFWQWLLWFSGPPVSVLLIQQIAGIGRLPGWTSYGVLLLIPAAWLAANIMMALGDDGACAQPGGCEGYFDWLMLTGCIAGAVALITLWVRRGLFATLHADKLAKDRYWLVLSLVILNTIFLAIMLLGLTPVMNAADIMLARTVIGLGFVYIAGTGLFRIYPQALETQNRLDRSVRQMTNEERVLAAKIEELFALDKVYQEPEYSRTDLARELKTSETVISKIINDHFHKSLPQLLNEHRVEDAKRLLLETDAPVKTIAEEVGFNSTTSFNRAFKEYTGTTPSRYRVKKPA